MVALTEAVYDSLYTMVVHGSMTHSMVRSMFGSQILLCVVILLSVVVDGQGEEGEVRQEYGWGEIVQGWQTAFGDKDKITLDDNETDNDATDGSNAEDTTKDDKQPCQEHQLSLLFLFVVFVLIIILMLLSEWIDPMEVLRSSKHQMVIIEE